ncbi:hypothetical protein [Bdellovibrio sp. HCB274]|uniref:hypothetical protein n=1 Tax=Bdellovibrio sp. HCB274 TaxID=3394361 RepID=UPI0039B5B941
MKKMTLVLLMLLGSSTAFSKQLTVVCANKYPSIENAGNSSIAATMEIENINAKPELQQLLVDGIPSKQGQVTRWGFTKDTFKLYLQFGQGLYSSAQISLQDCQDSFAATGKAQYEQYVGGFAGTQRQNLTCTCALN